MNPLHLALTASVTLLSACDAQAPLLPHADEVVWHRVNHDTLGLSLELPRRFVLDVPADQNRQQRVIYRLDDYPVLSMSLMSKTEAARQGLWAGHEAYDSRSLSGQHSSLYRYKHCDGLFCMATHALVMDHAGRYLAIEFRSGRHQFGALEEHILNSITLHRDNVN